MNPAVLALVFMAANAVQVQGTSRCPTPAEVAAVLPELLPAEQDGNPATVWIETAGLDLAIEMRAAAGQVLFSRRLTSHGTCAELATVAAVVIASWTTERNSEISLQQPGVPAGPVISPAPVVAKSPEPPPSKRTREHHFDLGMGLGSTANSAGFVGAARLELGVRGRRWGVRAGIVAETTRDQALDVGTMTWRRAGLSVGPTFTWAGRAVTIESRADLLLGLSTASGRGYDSTRQSKAVAPGLALAGRAGIRFGRLRAWIEMSGQTWFAEQVLTVTKAPPPNATWTLPRLEARALLGLSFFFSRES
jgi:hypothetical protein